MPSLLQAWALPAAILAIVNISATWYNLVANEVPEPYLDEFFHVPQAQKYCKGDYSWDPKITTPPGLYLVTKVLAPVLGYDTSSFRALNAIAICLICLLTYGLLRFPRTRNSPRQQMSEKEAMVDSQPAEDDQSVILDAHSALNIALFPPLFFFSALYYTDVVSTLIVLLSYSTFVKKQKADASIVEQINIIYIGVMALLFRQTNIFWVAVFPAGMTVVNMLSENHNSSARSGARNMAAVLKNSWCEGIVYDCTVQNASFEDYAYFIISAFLAILRKPLVVLKATIPYIALLALFAGFVAWNGSVVLGDKSAHTATLHLPQMLYIWPYIAFFSAPLLVGPLLRPIIPLLPMRVQRVCEDSLNASSRLPYPSLLISLLFIAGSLAAIHFNTIVHPYTLADNRHFVFYVFKFLRRHPAIKYLASPIYFVCAWLALQSLGSPSINVGKSKRNPDARPTSDEAGRPPCKISFTVIWLATTTLSVVTAPLVEPRYLIVPWVIWRLHMPYTAASLSSDRAIGKVSYDMRLTLETVWFLAINAVVGYIFLHRSFPWPSEPGKVQRFMW